MLGRLSSRSPSEIRDRLLQEIRNVRLWLFPPRLPRKFSVITPFPALPNPKVVAESLRNTDFSAEIAALATHIRCHDFPILGIRLQTGPEICWRRDYLSRIETGTEYFRRVPYLDATRAGDHKVIWELNRHQHLVLLAQDFLINGNRDSLVELEAQLQSWFAQNPFQRGINWASALEVAFRALSWIWVLHLVGNDLSDDVRSTLIKQLYWHGWHLETNLSYYFAPNTHLLGEAVALHAIGTLLKFPKVERWAQTGARVVHTQMGTQMRADGTHFEQSTYYHLYAVDMFLFHMLLVESDQSKIGEAYRPKLERGAEYLHALLGQAREMPFFGDDDGGRFFHPYGNHARYGRATLATCADVFNRRDWPAELVDWERQGVWWIGPKQLALRTPPVTGSKLFPDAGIAVLTSGSIYVAMDAGPFGRGSGGHSHSDTLSIVARNAAGEILIDPGTYTYVGDPQWREHFRGSGAHNTIRINSRDQATPAGPFRWNDHPEVKVLTWTPGELEDEIEAECRYFDFVHRRRVVFLKSGALFLKDTIESQSNVEGDQEVERFWHLGGAADRSQFAFSAPASPFEDWRSPAFGRKESAQVMRVLLRCPVPCTLGAAIALAPGSVRVASRDHGFEFLWTPIGGAVETRRF